MFHEGVNTKEVGIMGLIMQQMMKMRILMIILIQATILILMIDFWNAILCYAGFRVV